MDKIEFLSKYHRDVEIINDDLGGIEAIPQSWKDILQTSGFGEKKAKILNLWRKYVGSVLSNTILYLEDNLEGIDLIRYSGKYSLLYSIKMPNRTIVYYEGGNPGSGRLPDELHNQWNRFPAKIRDFYENLHNGFYYYASGSMGIMPTEDILLLGEEDWGILDELKEPLKINLDSAFGVFSSGVGGYVAVDTSDCVNDKATLWFSNRQPKYDLIFWDIVDEWMVIGFQN